MKAYKEVKIVFSGSLERILVNELEVLKITRYIIIPELKVAWDNSLKYLNTHIWPGTGDMIIITLEEDKVEEFVGALKILKENLNYEARMDVFITPLEYVNI